DDRDGDTVVDRDRCIGCGLCVSACDYDAVRLQRRPETKTPPRTQNRLYTKITMERYGLLGTAGMVGKNLLGMKV
ncbi:MAG: 4Fe-4S dicluster domain-containing protein, partial [Gammaproteobacteria bacterium]|nr:4Fe-4S dicluster domain-containing protein [Gemmatimonadota bacterium]NIR41509.1 4Fe-4S dicluster domain-containing protein [Actinomycetota bacterium]NIU74156.1 4Fe-4S dicluster domain-containing protein [Gammaproteobacteria bacterium]NIY08423.1 4Fe-4S dicluster domain-containing protein [Gemmatimonadota bacterium]